MLDELGKNLFYINYYFQGEPFLNPDFLAFVQEANKRKIYTATSTNAHFIKAQTAEQIIEAGLSRLIISIDGITQSSYEDYRVHGILNKVLEGTQEIVAAKRVVLVQQPLHLQSGRRRFVKIHQASDK